MNYQIMNYKSYSLILAHPELQVDDPEFDLWCDKVIEAQEQAKNSFTRIF